MTTDSATESDQVLAERAREDRAVFGLLYDRYVERVYRYCHRRLGNCPDAEDVTSVVFLRAMECIGSYRGGSFAAWLFAIARSSLADRFRERSFGSLDAAGELIDANPRPEDVAMHAAEVDSIRSLLSELTLDQREMLELRLSGLDGQEIATVMNLSADAVKMLQFRAMQRLRIAAAAGEKDRWLT